MARHKNDYSIIVFFEDKQKPKKWKHAHKLNGFSTFLDKKHPAWEYMNVYNRRTGEFIKRFYRYSLIPDFVE